MKMARDVSKESEDDRSISGLDFPGLCDPSAPRSLRVLAISTHAASSPSPAIRDQLDSLRRLAVEIQEIEIDRTRKSNYLRAVFQLREALRTDSFDLVHAFYGHCGVIALSQRSCPVVVTFQGSDLLGGAEGHLHRKDGAIGRFAARRCAGAIVMSEQMRRLCPREDARVVPFGINRQIFSRMEKTHARTVLGLPQESRLVLFPWDPSRAEKNFDDARNAVELLRDRWPDTDLLVLFGRRREDVALHMNACDAMVLTSDHEGSPVAVREALACGLPVVSVAVGDVERVLAGCSDCFVVDRNPRALAGALCTVLSKRMRSNGSEAHAHDNAETSARAVLALYREVLRQVEG